MRLNLSVDLSPRRAAAELAVRSQAEEQRMRFITPGDGKAMAYQQKAMEAMEYARRRDAGEPVPEDEFPHVFGEAAALDLSPDEMAGLILQLRRQWQMASATIERIERESLIRIAAAASLAELEAATDIDWTQQPRG